MVAVGIFICGKINIKKRSDVCRIQQLVQRSKVMIVPLIELRMKLVSSLKLCTTYNSWSFLLSFVFLTDDYKTYLLFWVSGVRGVALPRQRPVCGSRWGSVGTRVWFAAEWCHTVSRSSQTGPAGSAPPGTEPGRLQRGRMRSSWGLCSSTGIRKSLLHICS